MIFPVWKDGELQGFQARYYGTDDLPKYITRYKNDSSLYVYVGADNPDDRDAGVVVVEDFFSAIRCSRIRNAVAILGTEMSDKCLDQVANSNDRVAIMLDDDNLTVKQKAVVIRDRLTMVGVSGIIIVKTPKGKEPKDPKEHTPKELRDILEKVLPKKIS